MATTVLVAGARTPIGKLSGSLSTESAPDLGGAAIRAALERAGIGGEDLDSVFLGNVVQAGVGPNPARQAALNGGVPLSVPATTINKLCLSGMTAIALADQGIRSGYQTTVLAGGMESMTNAPHLYMGSRKGLKYGAGRLEDALERDALLCAIDGELMGSATERYQRPYGISRSEQDDFAVSSHEKAATATSQGRFAEEITPINIKIRNNELKVHQDEGIRPGTTSADLAKLRPAFGPEGTITAGSASQLSDGACAIILMDKDEAKRRGLEWIAEIVSYGSVAGPDPSLILQPARAIQDALRRHGSLTVADLDVVEINEAFAGVALASTRELSLSSKIVNPNGGAIALGHPVGMSGARLILSLALELRRRGGGVGAAALCGGGGQGDALVIKAPQA